MESRRSTPAPLLALPVALLLTSIGYHGYQVVAHEDDPQRGGAFAMFATIDIGATRKVLVTTDGGAVQVELPDSLDERVGALLDRPTEDAAGDLAADLLDLTWTVEDGRATVAADGGTRLDDVRLQVVGFEADGHAITRHELAEVSVDAP